MPMTSKEMLKLLKQHGFVEVRQVGSHIQLVNKETGKKTTVPFHTKDLPVGTEKNILKQTGIKK